MKILHITAAIMEKFTGNLWIALAVSVILITTASAEVLENISEIRAHHGILIFGISNLLRTLPEFFMARPCSKSLRGGEQPSWRHLPLDGTQ